MSKRRLLPIGPLAIALRHRGDATPQHRLILMLTVLSTTALAAGIALLVNH